MTSLATEMFGINLLWSSDFSRFDPSGLALADRAGSIDSATVPQGSGTVNPDAPDGEQVPGELSAVVEGGLSAFPERDWQAPEPMEPRHPPPAARMMYVKSPVRTS